MAARDGILAISTVIRAASVVVVVAPLAWAIFISVYGEKGDSVIPWLIYVAGMILSIALWATAWVVRKFAQ